MIKRCQIAAIAFAVCITIFSGCIRKDEPKVDFSSIPSMTADTPVKKNTPDKPDKKSTDTNSSKNENESTKNSDTDTVSKTVSESPKAEYIIVSENSLTLTVGDEKIVNANVFPENEKIIWSSNNEKIAVADESGRIVAIGAGLCTITASAESDKSIFAEIGVTVNSRPAETSSASSSEPAPTVTTTSVEDNHENNTASENENTPENIESISISMPSTVIFVDQTLKPSIDIYPENAKNKNVTLTTSDNGIVSINDDGSITAVSEGACTLTVTAENNNSVVDSIILTVTRPIESNVNENNETEYNDDDYPREEFYIDDILIVNKTYSIPPSYNPGGLTDECASAFEELRKGASEDGIYIYLSSGFRSYDYQSMLYNGYVSYYGQASADTFSARPGHSEHQTGLAIDCNIINDSFAGTPEAIWLEEHCHEYGFIIRYPYGKQSVTGYKYEPWHIRYIGDKATEIYESGLTLEEYFGLSSSYE